MGVKKYYLLREPQGGVYSGPKVYERLVKIYRYWQLRGYFATLFEKLEFKSRSWRSRVPILHVLIVRGIGRDKVGDLSVLKTSNPKGNPGYVTAIAEINAATARAKTPLARVRF